MFGGKGGVGKSTCASATALHYASLGKPTLAISTDGTPSLTHIFEIPQGSRLARVNDSLDVSELGINEVREMWDRKFGREVYQVFSSFVAIEYNQFVDFMTSLLPGLYDEFILDYIRELSHNGKYQVIVWDTAPLGQTLALLQTPAILSRHLRMAPRIYSHLKVSQNSRESILNIIRRWEKLSAENMAFLQNDVEFTMVTIPEALAVEQLEGIFAQLKAHGISVTRLIVNNLVIADESNFLRAKAAQQRTYLDLLHRRYAGLPRTEVPMFPGEVKGLERLRQVGRILCGPSIGR